MTDGIPHRKQCPVCASDFMFHIMDVPTRRTRRDVPLYACLDCGSMSNAAGYVEDDAQFERDLQWNMQVESRNRGAARRLFQALAQAGVTPASLLEIGCGIGVLVDEAGKAGIPGVGFDINTRAVEYGKKTFGADLHAELWDSATLAQGRDLTLCIRVLEHIAEPRPLIAELAKFCAKWGGRAFISVPFLDRDKWKFLLDPDPLLPGTPFFDNDVHVTHFSRKGLERCLQEHGATRMQFVRGGLWEGILAAF
jgi:SAM-dependent methyltransferase